MITENAIYEVRTDNRLYIVWRNGRSYKRYWNELSATEKAHQIEAENRAAYENLFCIY